ncbi:MAG: N-acetylmuramoyl-L-alanine amidase [Prolixibacteraceae bacterium]|nr:N-acetylmuramoyl-L-alanine amidase [Prolixibacteraceae bacterium]
MRTVVIDAGHGGKDPGAVSAGIREKDITLDVATKLGNMIKAQYPDVKVVYTRSRDVFLALHERAEIANKNKADLFMSIHVNCVSSPSASGTETFSLGLHRSQENLEVAKKENSVILLEDDYNANYEGFNPNEAESYIMFENLQSEYQNQSIHLAASIQEQFQSNLSMKNRGVKQAGFLVLREAGMPSILTEIGFLSNPADRKLLTTAAGKEKVVKSLFNAFSSYKQVIDQRSNFQVVSEESSYQISGAEEEIVEEEIFQETVVIVERKSEKSEKWYGVQVAATQKEVKVTPSNFSGEKNISCLKVGNIYKYISGRFENYKDAGKEKERLKKKFPDAFVVLVENGIPSVVKN